MADDNYPRPPRDPYARPSAAPQASNDPLAELARLIGQDSFAGLDQRAAQQPAPYAQDPSSYDPSSYASAPYASAPYAPSSYSPDPRAPQATPAYRDDDFGQPQFPEQQGAPPFAFDQAGGPYAPSFQPDGYAQRQQDDGFPHSHDDHYDDVRPARSRGLILGGAAAAALLLMVGGVWGYRSMFGSSRSTLPPPIIKAETAPSKVVPPPAVDPVSGKLIQDRVGERAQGERLVSREEQPVDRPAARVIFPGPTANSGSSPIAAVPADSKTSAGQNTASPSSTEPKKIRTIAIKPDGAPSAPTPEIIPPPVPARTASTPARVANAAPSAASDSAAGNNNAPSPVSRTVAPRVAAAPATAASAASAGGGPLSLTPDGVQPNTGSSAPAARAPAAPRVASAPASGVGSGGYVVQVSSQRSEADAQSSFASMKAKYPGVLGGREALIKRADLGEKGTYYRAMVGPFGGQEQANELCTSLKAAGGQCIVQKN